MVGWIPSSFGQHPFSLGVRLVGVSWHPKESKHPDILVRRLDKRGRFVVNVGAMVYAEYRLLPHLNIKVTQSFFSDCAGMPAGFSHIGLKAHYNFGQQPHHQIGLTVGPTLFYRKNWNELDGYVDEGFFINKGNTQRLFIPYGMEINYDLFLKDKTAISTGLVPGYPEIFLGTIGIYHSP